MTRIEKVDNGYILSDDIGNKEIVNTTDDLFKRLLLILEGRTENFTGDMYGRVIIHRSQPETSESIVPPVLMQELAEMKEINETQAYCIRNNIGSYKEGKFAKAQDYEIECLLEHVEGLEAELDARREDSKVLTQVVNIMRPYRGKLPDVYTASMVSQIIKNYLSAPEIREQTIDPVLREQIAKQLHMMFMAMVQRRQENGSIPGGATDVVRYDQLHDLSKEYLYEQVDKILDVLRGAQQC